MSRWNLMWVLVIPGFVFMGLAVTASAPPPDKDYQLVRSIVDVLAEVDRSYVRELNEEQKQKLVEDMINGGLEKLDPHSQYINEKDLAAFDEQSKGQIAGIGVIVVRDPKTNMLKVETPMPGTPAYNAGIQADDLILKIGPHSTENMKTEDARKLIKGDPNTQVTLTLLRRGTVAPFEMTITRAKIDIHPVSGFARNAADPAKWDWFADPAAKIAIIRLTGFNEKSDKEIKAALDEARQQGMKAVVLDMRDNPGGLLNQAVTVADIFLAKGGIVSTKGRGAGGRNWEAKDDGSPNESAEKLPMAVLINHGSASASEIVAAALQDNGRAIVVGERSYGKGTVQKVFDLPESKAAVKLTTEKWFTPAQKNIHRWPEMKESDEWGVSPNEGYLVPITYEERVAYIAHMNALDLIKGKPGTGAPEPTPPPKVDPPKKPYSDKQLDKALEYLRTKSKDVGELILPRHRRAA